MKLYKNLIIGMIALLPLLSIAQTPLVKMDISVLIVGYSGENPMPENMGITALGGMTPERFKQEYGKRIPAFKTLLSHYFSKVSIIDAREYKQSDSDYYDVTIFDQLPTPLTERAMVKDPETGKVLKYEPAKYISSDFDKPTIFIGHIANTMGRPLGSKLDWY